MDNSILDPLITTVNGVSEKMEIIEKKVNFIEETLKIVVLDLSEIKDRLPKNGSYDVTNGKT